MSQRGEEREECGDKLTPTAVDTNWQAMEENKLESQLLINPLNAADYHPDRPASQVCDETPRLKVMMVVKVVRSYLCLAPLHVSLPLG